MKNLTSYAVLCLTLASLAFIPTMATILVATLLLTLASVNVAMLAIASWALVMLSATFLAIALIGSLISAWSSPTRAMREQRIPVATLCPLHAIPVGDHAAHVAYQTMLEELDYTPAMVASEPIPMATEATMVPVVVEPATVCERFTLSCPVAYADVDRMPINPVAVLPVCGLDTISVIVDRILANMDEQDRSMARINALLPRAIAELEASQAPAKKSSRKPSKARSVKVAANALADRHEPVVTYRVEQTGNGPRGWAILRDEDGTTSKVMGNNGQVRRFATKESAVKASLLLK